MAREPRIGVGVIVHKDGRVLLGKRRGAHGAGCWQFPGGHLEFGEEVEDCAVREVFEETGLHLGALQRGPYTNDIFGEAERHYVTLFVLAQWRAGAPSVREPDKCERWDWYAWHAMPEPLFLPIRNLLARGWAPDFARDEA